MPSPLAALVALQTNFWELISKGSALANAKGEWVIEGYGVDPDIDVDNDPASEIAGRDPQLERGIAEVMAKLKTPVKLPPRPAAPVKTIR